MYVYIKMDMNYIHSKPEPEMEGRVRNIRKKWDKQYFIKKGFFINKPFNPSFVQDHSSYSK